MGQWRELTEVMMAINRWLVVLGASLLFTTAAMGQNVSEQYCKQIEDSVVTKLNPTKMQRREVYSDECVFEFIVADGTDVTLRVEINDTEEDSHESLEGYLSLVAHGFGLESEKELPLEKLDTNYSWDEIYFKKAGKINSGFILLRKGKVAITMLSLKDEVLIKMEQFLREKIGCETAVATSNSN
jgi:hypothetical protein